MGSLTWLHHTTLPLIVFLQVFKLLLICHISHSLNTVHTGVMKSEADTYIIYVHFYRPVLLCHKFNLLKYASHH